MVHEGNVTSLADLKEKKMFEANKAQFGDKIRERRIACGLNQPQLARLLNVRRTPSATGRLDDRDPISANCHRCAIPSTQL